MIQWRNNRQEIYSCEVDSKLMWNGEREKILQTTFNMALPLGYPS